MYSTLNEQPSSEVEEFRSQLQDFVRYSDVLDNGHVIDGEQLSASSIRAMLVLLECHAQEQFPMLTDLVDMLGIDKSNVTRLCQKLEASGYILISRDDDDRRVKRVSLSEEGLEVAREVNRISFARFSRLLEHIPDDDRQEVMRSLNLLNQAIQTLV